MDRAVKRTLAIALVAAAWLLPGCGPARSTLVISQAEAAMERARVAEAHLSAPYEYYGAKLYLHKAKEEWGYSDFEASRQYAVEAQRQADAALRKAKEDPWEGSPVPNEALDKASQERAREREAMERRRRAPVVVDPAEEINRAR